MAKARIDRVSLDRFRLSVCNMQNSIESINNSISDIDTQINKIEVNREKAQKALTDLNRRREQVVQQIQRQQQIVLQLSNQVAQISADLASTPPTIEESYQCGTDTEGNPIYATRTVVNPAYVALQSQLASAQEALARAQEQLSKLQDMLSKIETQISKLQNVIEKCTTSITKLRNNREKMACTSDRIQRATTLASDKLNAIQRVVDKYNSVKIQQQPMVPTRKFAPGVSLTLGRDMILPKQDLTDAERGANKYLRNLGVDTKKLKQTKTDDEKRTLLLSSGVDAKAVNTVLSIAKGNFLPNVSGSFNQFLDTSRLTTGDSAEWYRTCIETERGNPVQKEVHYDLTPYQGKKMSFLGYDEEIHKPFRSTDIVVNGDVHQELKVGLWKPNKRGEIRAELYADALRLEDPAHANDKQEYRIYKSAITGYSLFDDKEQAGYILKMQERYPDRVSVYYNDVKLSVEELKKIAGEDL